jgi:DNA-binding GntR family transcriptional regulator
MPQRTFPVIAPVEQVDIGEVIAARLRQLLAEGKFAAGEQITEGATAAAFNVSRGPVREAFKRLTQEGLLRSERNRGVFVPVLSVSDVEDNYLLREAVEGASLERLIASPDSAAYGRLGDLLERFEQCLAEESWDAADELDLAFHRELVHAAKSPRLRQAFDTVIIETRMCLRALKFHHPQHPDMAAWHRDILEAVIAGDADRARRALRHHNATVLADLRRSTAHTADG